MNELQAIAADYASHGLKGLLPVLPVSKVVALDHWKTFQTQAPSEAERNAMFSEPGLNIAIICGSVSDNVIQIDAETPRARDLEYERLCRVGLGNTWISSAPSGGGHFFLKTPFAVKSRGKVNDVEVKAQNTYCLAPPSLAVSKVDGSVQPYEFVSRPPQILTIESVDQVPWLRLEPAALHIPLRTYSRKVQRLLKGEWDRSHYETRSEAEYTIIVCLVNAGYSFTEIEYAFNNHKAAGKYAELQSKDAQQAADYLWRSYTDARAWCANPSTARKNALELLNFAQSIPWRGKSGSSQRAVFIAHCGLNYKGGKQTYHASARDLAEVAGVSKSVASTATARLCAAGAVKLVQESAHTFAARYELPKIGELEKQTNTRTLIKPYCGGVSGYSSFLLPEAFRRRGLGLSCYEVLQALGAGPASAPQIAKQTGRHVQTTRSALNRLKRHGLTAKSGKLWRGRAVEDIDLEDLSRAVCMRGAEKAQKECHQADRIRLKLRHKIRQQTAQSEQGDA